VIPVGDLLKEAWAEYEKLPREDRDDDYARAQLKALEDNYKSDKGQIVKFSEKSPYGSLYAWYPPREAPDEDVKGLARLKGHLQKGKWLTKFRKEIRKDEMADDLVLTPVAEGQEQDYTRIMPTSPP